MPDIVVARAVSQSSSSPCAVHGSVYNGNVRRRELVRRLNALGWFPVRQGKHEIFGHPDKAHTIPVPRHTQIAPGTARKILAAAQP